MAKDLWHQILNLQMPLPGTSQPKSAIKIRITHSGFVQPAPLHQSKKQFQILPSA